MPEARPIRNAGKAIHERVARNLAIAILSGHHAADASLPNEVEASLKLGVSRTAYREAIRTLVAKGLVASRPKSGTKVRASSEWNILDPDVLDWMFEAGPRIEFINAIFELRRIVEPAAAALAAVRRTPDQLARIGHALEELALFGFEAREGQIADRRFHELIFDATGNPALSALTPTITAAVEATTSFKVKIRPIHRDPLPEHRALFAAIADQDGERAHRTSLELIELAMQDLRNRIEA